MTTVDKTINLDYDSIEPTKEEKQWFGLNQNINRRRKLAYK